MGGHPCYTFRSSEKKWDVICAARVPPFLQSIQLNLNCHSLFKMASHCFQSMLTICLHFHFTRMTSCKKRSTLDLSFLGDGPLLGIGKCRPPEADPSVGQLAGLLLDSCRGSHVPDFRWSHFNEVTVPRGCDSCVCNRLWIVFFNYPIQSFNPLIDSILGCNKCPVFSLSQCYSAPIIY